MVASDDPGAPARAAGDRAGAGRGRVGLPPREPPAARAPTATPPAADAPPASPPSAVAAPTSAGERGRALFEQGRYREALPLFHEALAADPADIRMLSAIAASHFRLGEYDLSEAAYAELGRRDPADREAARFLALSQQGRQGPAQAPPRRPSGVARAFFTLLVLAGLVVAFLAVPGGGGGGEARVEIPDVRNLSAGAAERRLARAGLAADVQPPRFCSCGLPRGFVFETVPPAGVEQPKDVPVSVFVSDGS